MLRAQSPRDRFYDMHVVHRITTAAMKPYTLYKYKPLFNVLVHDRMTIPHVDVVVKVTRLLNWFFDNLLLGEYKQRLIGA